MNVQLAGQLMFPSPLVTVPAPAPVVLTVSANCGEKVAVTLAAEVPTVRLHVPVPVQAPVQPAKTNPAAGEAVRLTAVPVAREALQDVLGQLIPPTSLVTVPELEGVIETLTESVMKSALTAKAEPILAIVHVVPLGAGQPVHPLNTEPAWAVAVRVTGSPIL